MALANPLMNPALVEGVECVIFDCDGVLIDSYEANMRYYGMVREELGLPPLSDDERYFVHSRTHKAAIAHIVPEELTERAWEIIRAFDSLSLMKYLKPNDGIHEFLRWLRSAGFKLAVNTSRTDNMEMIFKEMKLDGFFFPVMTSGKVVHPKPHPEGVFEILRVHGVAREAVAFVGDSVVDEKTARAAGVRFWAYGDDGLDAEVHINSFWDIKAVMQRVY